MDSRLLERLPDIEPEKHSPKRFAKILLKLLKRASIACFAHTCSWTSWFSLASRSSTSFSRCSISSCNFLVSPNFEILSRYSPSAPRALPSCFKTLVFVLVLVISTLICFNASNPLSMEEDVLSI
jgi:hypothetical protein